jgi:hypothetical protein
MALIKNPALPPRQGYVEDEDETGHRYYRKVLSTEITELMLAVAELAETQASDKLELQLAVAELAETLMGGD